MAARILCSVFVVAALVGCAKSEPNGTTQSTLTIAGQTLSITKAVTPEELTKGLGGVSALGWNEGMLFVFEGSDERVFWMKGMSIPIDIIWLNGDTVAGFEANVPPPADVSIPDSSLPLYRSPASVNFVLEVKAGFVARYGVREGDQVVSNLLEV